MTEQKRPTLTIKRKPKIFVNPKHANKPTPPPPKPAKTPKAKAPKPVKEPKPKQEPPKPLSREERMARNRAKKLRRGQEAIAGLMAHWPQLFSLEQPKPLKIGIAEDIYKDIKARELELTRAKAGAALMFYTQTPVYLEAVCAGGNRFDLSGQPCAAITEKQKTYAQEQRGKWRNEADATAPQGAEPTP
ncbi:ProQ/FinO family protein [Sodalis endosymbiont of Spalangia cameroni]|uniref:ProQ/FinO family protein n=1 Tax=Sodalis praecaptivus TaxID=1239307 RepID=UPI0031F7D243